jgi:hypothetical protein
MQNKKYFFGLAVLMVALVGIFGLRSEAGAANCCYSNNQCHRDKVGSCLDAIIGGCPKCTDTTRGTDEGCCDGIIATCSGLQTDGSCGLNATEKWCCATGCVEIYPGGTCASGSPTEKPCNQIGACGGTKGGCCVDKSKTPTQCESPKSDGTCTNGTRQDNECSYYCSSAVTKCCVDSSKSPATCEDPKTDGSCTNGVAKEGSCTSYCSGGASGGGGSGGSGTSTTTEFTNPLGFNSIDGVLTSLLGSLKGFVVILAIIFIVIGGIMYMLSAGDPKKVEQAKNYWFYSVVGLAIVVAAPTFLKQVQEILGGTLTGGGIETARSVKDIANGILKFLLSITGIIAIISLVIAGGMYMTAYGEEKQITTAKSIGKWAIVGIIVALGSLTIIQQVSKLITG